MSGLVIRRVLEHSSQLVRQGGAVTCMFGQRLYDTTHNYFVSGLDVGNRLCGNEADVKIRVFEVTRDHSVSDVAADFP